MYVVWKILGTLGRYVDNESIPLKINFISVLASSSGTSANPCFPLHRAYLLLLCIGPLIPTYSLVGKHHVMERSKHIWLIGSEFSRTIIVGITLEVKGWEAKH